MSWHNFKQTIRKHLGMSFNYKDRDYLHNYEKYIKKYNFKLLDLNLSTPDSGIFYFTTN